MNKHIIQNYHIYEIHLTYFNIRVSKCNRGKTSNQTKEQK